MFRPLTFISSNASRREVVMHKNLSKNGRDIMQILHIWTNLMYPVSFAKVSYLNSFLNKVQAARISISYDLGSPSHIIEAVSLLIL